MKFYDFLCSFHIHSFTAHVERLNKNSQNRKNVYKSTTRFAFRQLKILTNEMWLLF